MLLRENISCHVHLIRDVERNRYLTSCKIIKLSVMSARDRQRRNNGIRHALRGETWERAQQPRMVFIAHFPDSCYYLSAILH